MKISSKIIPAILESNVKDFTDKLQKVYGLTDWVQIDIADGKFVNNKTFELKELQNIEILNSFFVEAHLMVESPENYFQDCQKLNFKRLIVHFEAVESLQKLLDLSKSFNFEIGIALNPQTPIESILNYLDKINTVVFLSVEPGFQGQKFIESTLEKIKKLKEINSKIKIEVDGGINMDNVKMVADAGADYLAVGSGLFDAKNVKERFVKLSEEIK